MLLTPSGWHLDLLHMFVHPYVLFSVIMHTGFPDVSVEALPGYRRGRWGRDTCRGCGIRVGGVGYV